MPKFLKNLWILIIYITTSDGILNWLNQPCSGILQGYHVGPKLQDQEPSWDFQWFPFCILRLLDRLRRVLHFQQSIYKIDS